MFFRQLQNIILVVSNWYVSIIIYIYIYIIYIYIIMLTHQFEITKIIF